MNTPPDVAIVFGWIGTALIAAAGLVMTLGPIIVALNVASPATRGADDSELKVAGGRVGNFVGLAILPMIAGLIFTLISAWLSRP